jgi:hypothetical protein
MTTLFSRHLAVATCTACLLIMGCASPRVATRGFDNNPIEIDGTVPQMVDVEHGAPRPLIDGIGWVVGIPSKIVLLDSRADNHHVSEETESELTDYMVRNQLYDSKVRINQYAPADEWRRLRRNESIGAGWRYTFGALHTLGYTVFPGRVFGRDSYNPYTDSVHIYSDIPSLAIEQAATAKIVRQHEQPGLYTAAQHVPFFGLEREYQAKQDVHSYYAFYGTENQQREASEILTPQFGSEVGDEIDSVLVVTEALPIFRLAGAGVGHIVGRTKKLPPQHHRSGAEYPSPSPSPSLTFQNP